MLYEEHELRAEENQMLWNVFINVGFECWNRKAQDTERARFRLTRNQVVEVLRSDDSDLWTLRT